ncbi:MAG: hypothetical protein M3430_05210 [Acidobacteriota bacterium]|nr:hypothetical protein [Acidobacteriota bacterium]
MFTVLGGVVLSFVLLTVGIWAFLQTSAQGEWLRESAERGRMPEYQETVEKYGDPFDMMTRGVRVMQFVLLPSVALLVGAFVGLLARDVVWQMAAISLVPLLVLVLFASAWEWDGFALSGVYIALCCAASLLLHRWRGKKHASGTAHV